MTPLEHESRMTTTQETTIRIYVVVCDGFGAEGSYNGEELTSLESELLEEAFEVSVKFLDDYFSKFFRCCAAIEPKSQKHQFNES